MTIYLPPPQEALPILDSSIPFLPENETEVVRQLVLHQHLSKYLHGPLPYGTSMQEVRRVLDVACGVGAWCLELAKSYPEVAITGIDSSPYFIEQARSYVQPHQHITYHVQDMYQLPQAFPHQRFDLIHLRFLIGAIGYPQLLDLATAVARVCQRNGTIIWHEAEFPLTTSLACDELTRLILLAMERSGHAFSFGMKQQLGIMDPIIYWMRQAGCEATYTEMFQVEICAGTLMHEHFVRQLLVFGHQIRPFLLQTGTLTAIAFEELFAQVQREVHGPYFCGICPQYLFCFKRTHRKL